MHRIVKAHLDSFVESNGLAAESEASQFEKFVNFSVLSNACSTDFDIDDVTAGPGEDGIDGVAVIIDEVVISNEDDAAGIFASKRRNHDVTVLFTQSKRTEGFDLGDFLKFKEAILRFASNSSFNSTEEILFNARKVFEVVLNEAAKIKNGRPSLIARYVTTGVYQSPNALEIARNEFKTQLVALGLFHEIDIKFVGRDDLTDLYVKTYSGTSATIEAYSIASLPRISGIEEAYLAVVKASDFVNNFLVTPDGNLRTQVFEENVRSFLGLDNPVNQSISTTLNTPDSSSRFPILNNGITIVSPDVNRRGDVLNLSNYQIVNGCQTSNVLFENMDNLGDTMVNIKVVETQNEDVFSELVRATNSQTKVDNNQFLSLRPIIKSIEQYFNTYNEDSKLYLERREKQYVGLDIPVTRIFSVQNAAKCVTAMYLGRPELSARYPKTMYEELGETLFAEDVKEIIFYASCLTLYRFSMLISNSSIPQNMKRFKWHILHLIKAIVTGITTERINSRAAERSANQIINAISQHSSSTTEIFLKAVRICQGLGDVSSDALKRQSTMSEMLAMVITIGSQVSPGR